MKARRDKKHVAMRYRTTFSALAGIDAIMRRCLAQPVAFLVIGLGVLLSSCSEQALVTEQARLHKAPATQSEVLAVIPKGSKVDASGCSDGWCRVSWNGKQGYALAKTLRARSAGSGAADNGREEEMDGSSETDSDAD
jgi:Bacterial SH3 domain